MPNHTLNFPWLVANPKLCSHAHVHVFLHTHTQLLSQNKERDRDHIHTRQIGVGIKEKRTLSHSPSGLVVVILRRCRHTLIVILAIGEEYDHIIPYQMDKFLIGANKLHGIGESVT